jgi:hypothetical protein
MHMNCSLKLATQKFFDQALKTPQRRKRLHAMRNK